MLALLMASAMPGTILLTTVSVASGVTSRGETPVPPVVNMRSGFCTSAQEANIWDICRSSSGQTAVQATSIPWDSSKWWRAGPEASSLIPLEDRSLIVSMAARSNFEPLFVFCIFS